MSAWRVIDAICKVRGSLPLPPGQSGEEALDRLDRLLQAHGTSCARAPGALYFTKRNAAAQDRMSAFDRGTVQLEQGAGASVLRYQLMSRALLFCFLAPLFFLAVARLTIAINQFDHGSHTPAKPETVRPMHPIDVALGAPAPEPPKKTKSSADDEEKKPSPTPAYVFAGLFTVLYLVGRVLEARLVKRRFQGALSPS